MFNFMGFHGEHFRKFDDKDIIGIMGEFKGRPRASNQSGKSSTIEAMTFALFGLSRAEKDIELIHYGEDVMWVELVLFDGDKKYKIKRGRDIKNNGILEVDFLDKKKEAQEAICELIGFDKKEFELTTFFKQSDISQFMDLGPAEKKGHIIKWFDIEHWNKLEKSVKGDLSPLNDELKTNKIKCDQLKATFDNDVDLSLEKQALDLQIAQLKKSIEDTEKKLNTLDNQQTLSSDELAEAREKRAELKDKLTSLQNSKLNAQDISKTIKTNKDSIEQWSTKNVELAVKNHDVQSLTKKQSEITNKQKLLKLKMKAFEDNSGGVCPIIHEACDRIQFSKEQYEGFKTEYAELAETYTKCERLLSRLEQIKGNDLCIKKAQESNSTLNEKLNKLAGIEDKAVKCLDDIEALTTKIKEYNPEIDTEKANLKSKIKGYKLELEQAQKQIGRIEEKVEAEKRNKVEVKRLTKEIKEISVKIDDLNYLAMMFGKNGIPSQEIENGFQQVEDDANHILQSMGTNMEITFKPTRELDAKEPSCLVCNHIYEKGFRGIDCPECQEPRRKKVKDELNFQVATPNANYGFHMDSGGGKALLSTSIRMALTQLKRRVGKCNLNVVFLDEIDSNLDEDNANQFIKLVTNVLTKKLGIAQVFWVTHNKDVQSSIPHTLKVIKHDGKAITKWA